MALNNDSSFTVLVCSIISFEIPDVNFNESCNQSLLPAGCNISFYV